MFRFSTVLIGFSSIGVYLIKRVLLLYPASERRLTMSELFNAILVTFQMMVIFFTAFYVVYLMALLLLPMERGLSKYVWDHTDAMKPAKTRGSFKEFSQKHHGQSAG
jgi:hypothetical protein